MAFREVSGEVLNMAEAGQKLTGWYIECQTDQGEKKNSTIITIQKEDGVNVSIWGSAVLDDKMAGLRIGDFVQIEYLGKRKNKTGTAEFKDWKVLVDDEKRRTIATPSDEASTQTTETQEPVTASEPTDKGDKLPWD